MSSGDGNGVGGCHTAPIVQAPVKRASPLVHCDLGDAEGNAVLVSVCFFVLTGLVGLIATLNLIPCRCALWLSFLFRAAIAPMDLLGIDGEAISFFLAGQTVLLPLGHRVIVNWMVVIGLLLHKWM